MSNYPSLTQVTLRNYKNLLVKAPLDLHSLNLLIGPNCSGKSNLIKVFQFLKDAVTAGSEATIGLTGLEVAIDQLGNKRILDGKLTPPATVNLEFQFSATETLANGSVLELSLDIPSGPGKVTIHHEELRNATPNPFYYYRCHNQKSGTGAVSIFNPSPPGSHFKIFPNVPVHDLALISITKLLEDSNISPETAPVYKARRQLLETIAQWRFYNANNMNLSEIRQQEPKIGGPDCLPNSAFENLSLVLFNLSNQPLDFEEQINNAMKTILPPTRRVRAIPSGRLGLTVEWYLEGVQEPFYLNEMSDGAVRMLCWATLLHSPQLPTLLVIDEPELGLHVAWMNILAEWIKQAARKTQVIIATHSPDLLDHFTEDHLEDILCFGKEGNYFVPTGLSRQKLSHALAEGWQVGDLYRVGAPEVGGWPW
jgi:predicted ATPase